MKTAKTLKHLLKITAVIFCLILLTVNNNNNAAAFIKKWPVTNNYKMVDSKQIKTKNNTTTPTSYFKKGVYLNYSIDDKNSPKDFFYIFYDENSGHTDDGKVGMGLPFVCEQGDGFVKFSFGGADPENEELLTVKFIKNGSVVGYFNKGKQLIFMPIPNVNPNKFDAQKYMKKHRVK